MFICSNVSRRLEGSLFNICPFDPGFYAQETPCIIPTESLSSTDSTGSSESVFADPHSQACIRARAGSNLQGTNANFLEASISFYVKENSTERLGRQLQNPFNKLPWVRNLCFLPQHSLAHMALGKKRSSLSEKLFLRFNTDLQPVLAASSLISQDWGTLHPQPFPGHFRLVHPYPHGQAGRQGAAGTQTCSAIRPPYARTWALLSHPQQEAGSDSHRSPPALGPGWSGGRLWEPAGPASSSHQGPRAAAPPPHTHGAREAPSQGSPDRALAPRAPSYLLEGEGPRDGAGTAGHAHEALPHEVAVAGGVAGPQHLGVPGAAVPQPPDEGLQREGLRVAAAQRGQHGREGLPARHVAAEGGTGPPGAAAAPLRPRRSPAGHRGAAAQR